MTRERELDLGDRLLARIEAGPPPATEPHTTLDVSVYTDTERHRREIAAMGAHPVAAIASSEVSEPGDFVTVELAGRPIIISRDRDGAVQAMLNVCAHRGATLETRASGSARIFSCQFHGWSYDLDGSLRAISDAPLFSSAPCDRGLRRLRAEERHGIVWVTPDPDAPGIEVAPWLGSDVDSLLTDLGLADMTMHATVEYDLACNWKMLTDGFLELYHLMYLHRNSIAPYFPANTTLYEDVDRHFVGWLPKSRLVRDLEELPRDEWRVWAGLTGTVILVPGTVVQWQAGHVELFSLRPDPHDPGRTTARLTMMVPADRAGETELWDRNWERVCETIPDEDFAAAVDVQRNIDVGAVTELQIGRNEQLLVEHLDAVAALSAG